MDVPRTAHAYHSSSSSSSCPTCFGQQPPNYSSLFLLPIQQQDWSLQIANLTISHCHPQPSPIKYLHIIVWLKEKRNLYHDLLNSWILWFPLTCVASFSAMPSHDFCCSHAGLLSHPFDWNSLHFIFILVFLGIRSIITLQKCIFPEFQDEVRSTHDIKAFSLWLFYQ